MANAFIIGVTGQIGHAVTNKFLAHGWHVTIASRSKPNSLNDDEKLRHVQINREEKNSLTKALSNGIDFLLDCSAYDSRHAKQLIEAQDNIGKICVISSTSVYTDDAGLTLDEAPIRGFPDLPVPITIQQPTVEPSDLTYSTRKVSMERSLLDHCQTISNIFSRKCSSRDICDSIKINPSHNECCRPHCTISYRNWSCNHECDECFCRNCGSH